MRGDDYEDPRTQTPINRELFKKKKKVQPPPRRRSANLGPVDWRTKAAKQKACRDECRRQYPLYRKPPDEAYRQGFKECMARCDQIQTQKQALEDF